MLENITLKSTTTLGNGDVVSLEALMVKELGLLDAKSITMRQFSEPSELPENVQKNTKDTFKPGEIEFLEACARVYRTIWQTRQMVCAVNRFRGQTSCPNFLNKNATCMTATRGLYRLPLESFSKGLQKELRTEMAEAQKAVRAQLAAAAKEKADKEKAAKAKSEKPAPAAEEKPAPKTKKTKKSAPAVTPTADVPAETPTESAPAIETEAPTPTETESAPVIE